MQLQLLQSIRGGLGVRRYHELGMRPLSKGLCGAGIPVSLC